MKIFQTAYSSENLIHFLIKLNVDFKNVELQVELESSST